MFVLSKLKVMSNKDKLKMGHFREVSDKSKSDSSLEMGLFIKVHAHSALSIHPMVVILLVFHTYCVDTGFQGYKNVGEKI